MTAFWMTLNFVLLLLAFYLILHLYQRIRLLQDKDQDSQGTQQLLAEHMEAVRLENEQFLSDLRVLLNERASAESVKPSRAKRTRKTSKVKNENHEEASAIDSSDKEKKFSAILSQEKEELNKTATTSKQNATSETSADKWVPPIDDVQDMIEESPYLQATRLKEKGYSITDIAKEMNRGKGEIELLLKLQGKVQS
ncbi:hypothetical protein [Sporolactobacillus laevolacticus]|uniref:hypothetical protein n=1 Tax=Sporolactobacillus laevolacticus TaxID=33018 RepID=UPI0025B47D96|nr:hypothetical protein [Sporolactobacillus laevolacticus]MDN3953977.1 hypothetical protein [Sporolactobacillus laevolacticus]